MNRSALTAALLTACTLGVGCSTSPRTEADRSALTAQANGTVSSFLAADPSLRELMDKSVGYAVFPDVGKAGFIAGAAYGKGEVFEQGRLTGYADIAQGTLGLQIGAQSYDELVLFLESAQLAKFKANQFTLSANLSAVAIKAGAAGAADHSKGVVVFLQSRGGLMAEASIGGQQFTFVPLGEAENREEMDRRSASSVGR